MTAKILISLIRAYQLVLSPFLGGSCRFLPTCSSYAIEAIRSHGALRGSVLGTRRVCACHPFGRSGFDPVPARSNLELRTSHSAPRASDLAPRASE